MRLGAPVDKSSGTPEEWIGALKRKGYRASFCPLPLDASGSLRFEYAAAAREAEIVIAEVGAWSNPLSRDTDEADRAFRKCVGALRMADEIGAACCVNISGKSRRRESRL